MTALRGVFGFIVFVVVFLLTLFITNAATALLSFMFTGWGRFVYLLWWSGVVGVALSVIAGKAALNGLLREYPQRTIAGVFMGLNGLVIAYYLLAIPHKQWTTRFWVELVQAVTAIVIAYAAVFETAKKGN